MKRTPLASGRARYEVRRPEWPERVVRELAYVLVLSHAGAAAIVVLLVWLGLLR